MPEIISLPKGKDLESVRAFLAGVKTLASTATIYEGPIRTMFEELQAKVEAALAALPKTTDANWSVNDQADQLLGLLGCCNNVAATLGLELNRTRQTMAGMVVLADEVTAGRVILATGLDAIVTTKIGEAIALRTADKGDLVTRATMLSMCGASEAAGIQKGIDQHTAALAAAAAIEAKAAERKTALTTAGIPLPEAALDAVLRGEDAVFAAAQTLAGDRLKKLTTAGIHLTPDLLGKVWLDEAGYKTFESTVHSIPALKRVAAPDEPLAAPTGGGSDGKRIIM